MTFEQIAEELMKTETEKFRAETGAKWLAAMTAAKSKAIESGMTPEAWEEQRESARKFMKPILDEYAAINAAAA